VQRANTILGRIALRTGDLADARQYFARFGEPAAAPDITLSGPTLVLAKELIEHGERETVLAYLESCLKLWPRGENVLRIWIADIKTENAKSWWSRKKKRCCGSVPQQARMGVNVSWPIGLTELSGTAYRGDREIQEKKDIALRYSVSHHDDATMTKPTNKVDVTLGDYRALAEFR